MLSLLRDFLLSFCPSGMRRVYPPAAPQRTLHAATWGGLAQFFLFALALVHGCKTYYSWRAHQWAAQMTGSTEVFQAGVSAIVIFEYLLHPLSLLLLYLAVEGLARFFAGLATAEPLPNAGVFLAFKARQLAIGRRARRERAALPPDLMESLPDGRIRIASAAGRTHWNSSITVGVEGRWYEVERTEPGRPPRSFVYLLRPAPAGKILRRYEEYDAAAALRAGASAGLMASVSAAPAQK